LRGDFSILKGEGRMGVHKRYHRWQEIRARNRSPEQIAKIDREIEQELLEMDLRAVRELAGKTQVEVAAEVEMTQSEVSRFEKRSDVRLSTLRKYIEALGGELEISAVLGDKRVRLRALG
jgi:DNA-directed RNA polymerase specialized sigma subunit